MSDSTELSDATSRPGTLYFFPEEELTDAELREILSGSDAGRRVWAISHLLRYAQWEDIWVYVKHEEVELLLPDLDLPDTLRSAWGRMLKTGVPIG